MQFPIIIGLRRSLFLTWAIGLGHGLALMAVVVPAWPTTMRTGLALLVAVSAFLAWWVRMPTVVALRLQDDGAVQVCRQTSDEFAPATLFGAATVHPWLTVFRLRTEDGAFWVAVFPDSIDAADFRRLRIWLRWRADFSGQDAAA